MDCVTAPAFSAELSFLLCYKLQDEITPIKSLAADPEDAADEDQDYRLALSNYGVTLMFQRMVDGWFKGRTPYYSEFVHPFLAGNFESMNCCINEIVLATFSCFGTGKTVRLCAIVFHTHALRLTAPLPNAVLCAFHSISVRKGQGPQPGCLHGVFGLYGIVITSNF